jgi:hypothetical protein
MLENATRSDNSTRYHETRHQRLPSFSTALRSFMDALDKAIARPGDRFDKTRTEQRVGAQKQCDATQAIA